MCTLLAPRSCMFGRLNLNWRLRSKAFCSVAASMKSDGELQRPIILGIETSCDDCGAAVLDGEGTILSDAIHSQLELHIRFGGIIPPIAQREHQRTIGSVVDKALNDANMKLTDLDAIAVTVKPGLGLALKVGSSYALELCKKAKKPIIPVHHMRAHALTARIIERIEFPFLCFLISGGHCLLAIAKSVDEFSLLGSTRDDAPGEAFDKVARRLQIRNLGGNFERMSGGRAMEWLARSGNALAFEYPSPNQRFRDCSFSFSGLKGYADRLITLIEAEEGLTGGKVMSSTKLFDFCASFQHAIFRHLAKRLQRALEFISLKGSIPVDKRIMVISGGVACNQYITRGLSWVAEQYGYRTVVPPPKLCSDNGVMIAWNGVQLFKAGLNVIHDLPEHLPYQQDSPIGEDISKDVIAMKLTIQTDVKLNRFPTEIWKNSLDTEVGKDN